jgi:hypothetical protein
MTAERNKAGEGSIIGKRPDKVVRFGLQSLVLWRGEEKGPSTDGDPRDELLWKLEWTYEHLPFVMAYYARATQVTFYALHVVVDAFGKSMNMCRNLIAFDTARAQDQLQLVLACINLAKLLKTRIYKMHT